jgi:RNA polymerase sigma-70 factor, ECF subfamily
MSSARDVRRSEARGVVRALPITFADEASLGLAIVERRPAAAAAAFDRYISLVRGILRRTVGPHPDIDDLAQDVFLTLFRRASELRDPTALRSFVVSITVRVASAELRRRRVRRWLTLSFGSELPEVEAGPEDHDARRAVQHLYGILDRLDPASRVAFVLRHAEGLELTELADALDCSLSTAKRRLAKANERVLFHAQRNPTLSELLGRMSIANEDDPPRSEER